MDKYEAIRAAIVSRICDACEERRLCGKDLDCLYKSDLTSNILDAIKPEIAKLNEVSFSEGYNAALGDLSRAAAGHWQEGEPPRDGRWMIAMWEGQWTPGLVLWDGLGWVDPCGGFNAADPDLWAEINMPEEE